MRKINQVRPKIAQIVQTVRNYNKHEKFKLEKFKCFECTIFVKKTALSERHWFESQVVQHITKEIEIIMRIVVIND